MQTKLFKIEDKEPEIKEVKISDILIPEYTPPSYMVDSLEGFGNLDEVKLVRKGTKYEIVDGRRRLSTLKQQGVETVSAKVFDKLRDYERAMITLMSNYCRSHNIISELEALSTLEERGVSSDTIHKYLNVTKNKVSIMKRMLDLPQELYQALAENKITETLAKAIAKLNKKQQKKLAKIYVTNGKLSGTDVKELKATAKEETFANMDEKMFVTINPVDKLMGQVESLSPEDLKLFKKRLQKGGLL